jgi:hypothetical protein
VIQRRRGWFVIALVVFAGVLGQLTHSLHAGTTALATTVATDTTSGPGDLGFLNGKVNVNCTLDSGASVSRADAVSNAGNFLGPNSTEIAPNVWRSADGLTRFRMTLADHANFEMFNDVADKYPSINFHANYSDWP